MHFTIFKTPVLNTLMRWFSLGILRLLGWRLDDSVKPEGKCVLIAAPHTSNWDFPFALLVCFALRLDVYWMGKSSLFPPIIGGLMKWLGGIPVNRKQSNNLVEGTIQAFKKAEHLIVIVPPEGTRGKVTRWKTGFYYIAHGAGVPLCLGYLDFKEKMGGIGKLFYPTGDIEKDMTEIRQFYSGKTGKNKQQFESNTVRTEQGLQEHQGQQAQQAQQERDDNGNR